MTSQKDPNANWLQRLPAAVAGLLYIAAGCTGAALFLVLGAVLVLVLKIPSPADHLSMLAFAAIGALLLPLLIARARRRRDLIQTPPAGRSIPEVIPENRADHEMAQAPSSDSRPGGAGKKVVLAIGVCLAIVALLIILADNDLDLEVRTLADDVVVIRNVGSEPRIIQDLVINGRNDCSTFPDILIQQAGVVGRYSESELHKIWVARPSTDYLASKPDVSQLKYRRLEVGDTAQWTTWCSTIARINIKTDKGDATYSISK